MEMNSPCRYRFRFSLSTMFWLMLVVALGLFGIRERRMRLEYEARDQAFYDHRNKQQTEYEEQLELHRRLLAKELAEVRAVHPNFQTTPLKIVPSTNVKVHEW